MRPTRPAPGSVKNSLPLALAVMPAGAPVGERASVNSVTTPVPGSSRATLSGFVVVNQRFPSGPAVMSVGAPPDGPEPNSVIVPAGVIRPIPGFAGCVNQRLPSGPAAIAVGSLPCVSPAVYSVTVPVAGSRRPIASVAPGSVNQIAPSGPAATSAGSAPAVSPAVNSVRAPLEVIPPSPPGVPCCVNHTSALGPPAMPAGDPALRPVNSVSEACAGVPALSATTRDATGRVKRVRHVMFLVSAHHPTASRCFGRTYDQPLHSRLRTA